MDAMTEFGEKIGYKLEKFMVAGASKVRKNDKLISRKKSTV
jgi:hypothetical protein